MMHMRTAHYSPEFLRVLAALLSSAEGGQLGSWRQLAAALADRLLGEMDALDLSLEGTVGEGKGRGGRRGRAGGGSRRGDNTRGEKDAWVRVAGVSVEMWMGGWRRVAAALAERPLGEMGALDVELCAVGQGRAGEGKGRAG